MIKQSKISLRKGVKNDLPTNAPLGEPLFCMDTGEMYVGMGEDSPIKQVVDTEVKSQLETMANKKPMNANELNALLNSFSLKGGGKLNLDTQIYNINETLVIPYNVVLDLNNSKLNVTLDVNVFDIKKGGVVKNGIIDCTSIVFTKSVIYVDGINKYTMALNFAKDLRIIMNGTGNGIHFKSNPIEGHCISYLKMSNIQIEHPSKGIYLECPFTLGIRNWITGNIFNSIQIINPIYGIWLDGESTADVSGNFFDNVQIQKGANTINGVYCNGSMNIFNTYAWDFGGTNIIAYNFTNKSKLNKIYDNYYYYLDSNILNDGTYNTFLGQQQQEVQDVCLYKGKDFVYNPNEIFNKKAKQGFNMLGNQDDILAFATLQGRATCTIAPSAINSMNNAFIPSGEGGVYFPKTIADDEIVKVEIDMTTAIKQLGFLGIQFGSDMFPRYMKITVYNASGNGVAIFEETNNTKALITVGNISVKNQATHREIKKIVLEFKNPNQKNKTYLYFISRIFANSSVDNGKTYLETNGGLMSGNLQFVPGTSVVIRGSDSKYYRLGISVNSGTPSLTFTETTPI